MASPTPDAIVHAMANRSRAKMYMAATLSGGIYSTLSAGGKVIYEDGGPEIENPLIVGSNSNISMSRYYDQVNIAQTNELTTVKYNMTRLVGSLIISEQEQDENQGDAAIVKIAKAKNMALEQGVKKELRRQAATVAVGDEFNGLPDLYPTDPTTGTIGNQNLAVQPMYRPSAYDFAGTLSSDVIEEVYDDVVMDLTVDGDAPNMWLVGRNHFRMLRAAARDKAMISLTATGFGKTLAGLGLKGMTHQGMPVVYDELMDVDSAFCVNTEYLRLHILRSANMKVKKLTAPMDRDVIGRRYIYEAQVCSWNNYRRHARVAA